MKTSQLALAAAIMLSIAAPAFAQNAAPVTPPGHEMKKDQHKKHHHKHHQKKAMRKHEDKK